jgi:hypothetical protein
MLIKPPNFADVGRYRELIYSAYILCTPPAWVIGLVNVVQMVPVTGFIPVPWKPEVRCNR